MSAAVLIPAVAGLWFLAVVGVVGTCSAASRAEAAYLRGLRVRRLRVARRPVLCDRATPAARRPSAPVNRAGLRNPFCRPSARNT